MELCERTRKTKKRIRYKLAEKAKELVGFFPGFGTQDPGVLAFQIHTGRPRLMPWSSRAFAGSVWALRPDARFFHPATANAWRTMSVAHPSTTGAAPVRVRRASSLKVTPRT